MFIRELAEAFAAHGVVYAVLGGVAVNLHGVPRMTWDVDVAVATDGVNLERAERALAALRLLPRLPLRLSALSNQEERSELERERNLVALAFSDPTNPLREVDVLIAPSLDPDGLCARAVRLRSVGFELAVVALDDLIVLKRRAGRAQDLADLAHLERARERHD